MCMSTIERLEKNIMEIKAQRDYWKRLYDEAVDKIESRTSHVTALSGTVLSLNAEKENLKADSDRLQKRVEALERAVKKAPGVAQCWCCCYLYELGGGCTNADCWNPDYLGWQFDEARFAGGGDGE